MTIEDANAVKLPAEEIIQQLRKACAEKGDRIAALERVVEAVLSYNCDRYSGIREALATLEETTCRT